MRKVLLYLMITVLLLSACARPGTVPDESSTSQTESQKAPIETTQTTEVTVPEANMSVDMWQLAEPAYLSYEAYFATERKLLDASHSWIKDGKLFALLSTLPNMQVYCFENGKKCNVPTKTSYQDYNCIGADGRYGYFYNASQFLRLDLATGVEEIILENQDLHDVRLMDNLLVYYISSANGDLRIGRIYLPTMQQDILYEMQGEYYDVGLNTVNSTTEPVSWTMINPEMVDLLKAELANPNSQYKQQYVNGGENLYDYSEYWEAENGLLGIIENPGLLHHIQDTSGVRAFLKCIYNPVDGSLTKKTGVIDNCWHGSSYPHDHYNPEVTTADPVEVLMGEWKDLQNALPASMIDGKTTNGCRLLPDVASDHYPYVKMTDGYNKMTETPVVWAANTGNGLLYLSADKHSIYAVSYLDNKPVEIYRSKNEITIPQNNPGNLDLEKQWLVLLDGDTLVQIDLAAGKSRQLIRHPYILSYYYIDSGATTVYFDVAVGLYVGGHTIDLETGELRSGYRL